MTTTAQQLHPSAATMRPTGRRIPTPALIGAAIGLVTLTAVVATWDPPATTDTPDQVPAAVADPWAAYRPGGSMYEQQVPGTSANLRDAYPPSSSIYRQQVPRAAYAPLAANQPGQTLSAWQEYRAGERAVAQVPRHMGLTPAAWQEVRAGERAT